MATLEIPFSYMFSYLFTGELPNSLSAIGASLIFTAVVVMGAKVSSWVFVCERVCEFAREFTSEFASEFGSA